MNEHERWQDDLAAYALGGLDPEEAAEFEHHLEDCEHCQAGIRWLMPAINALPEVVEQVEPPPSLRTKIVGEVRRDAGEQPRSRRRTDRGWRHRFGAALRGSGSGPLALRPLAGLAAAALIVIAVGVGYAVGIDGGGEDGAGSTIVSGEAPGVIAKVLRDGDDATLRLENVSPLHGEKVLEAWVQRGERVVPVRALFAPDHEGHATTVLPDMKGVSAVMVTVEPSGGSEEPTSKPIATVPIPVPSS